MRKIISITFLFILLTCSICFMQGTKQHEITGIQSKRPCVAGKIITSELHILTNIDITPEKEIKSDKVNPVSEDVSLLAHLINAEAGSDYNPDELLRCVGSVVLNRVADDRFPNTLREVIFQDGQYQCTWNGMFDQVPTDRCYKIAEELLRTGSQLESDIIYQAEFEQGTTVLQIGNTYFGK